MSWTLDAPVSVSNFELWPFVALSKLDKICNWAKESQFSRLVDLDFKLTFSFTAFEIIDNNFPPYLLFAEKDLGTLRNHVLPLFFQG